MVKYTNPELTDIIYGEALSNADATRRLYVGMYMKRFVGRQVPCPHTFVNVVQDSRDYGTVSPVLSC
jgi:hypothetical protein